MSLSGTRIRYGSLAQTFHWLTALLVLVAFLVSQGGPPGERLCAGPRRDLAAS
jgi:cytochrome b561